MTRYSLAFPLFVSSLLGFGLAGCDKSDDDTSDEADEADGEEDDSGTADEDDSDGGSGSDDGTGSDTDEPGENGEPCETGADCVSGKCFPTVAGNYCGECETDADCPEGGCSSANPLSVPVTPSSCNMGELGGGCMSNDVCQSMICAPIIYVAGEPISGCSECLTDADCSDGLLCSPSLDIVTFTGHRSCVTAGSLADGEGCDFEGSGAEACQNYCALTADLAGTQIGLCGECIPEDNTGCETGEMCQRGSIDIAGLALNPATCVPAE